MSGLGRRREQNRESARSYRQRKSEYIKYLECELHVLRRELEQLRPLGSSLGGDPWRLPDLDRDAGVFSINSNVFDF
jgi:hypothetical protein